MVRLRRGGRQGRERRHRAAAVPDWRASWALPSVRVPGSAHTVKAPGHLPRAAPRPAPGRPSSKARSPATGPRHLLGREPAGPEAPDPQLADLERAELQVLRRQAQPDRIRELVEVSYARPKSADRGAKLILGGMFAAPRAATRRRKSPKRVHFASYFLDLMYETTPGIKSKFNGVALHPYMARYRH